MGVDDAGDRDPAAGELLDDHRVGREVEPEAAVLLRDRDPEEAELLHLLDDRLRVGVLVVVVLGVRQDLLVGELPDHGDDLALVLGDVAALGSGAHGHVLSLLPVSVRRSGTGFLERYEGYSGRGHGLPGPPRPRVLACAG